MNLEQIFGSGDLLTPLQMAARAFIMFFITLILIRIGGLRIFGKRTAFDNVLVIMLGAVLSRGVVGASPFLATVAAGTVFIFIHKVLGWLAIKFHWVGRLIKEIIIHCIKMVSSILKIWIKPRSVSMILWKE